MNPKRLFDIPVPFTRKTFELWTHTWEFDVALGTRKGRDLTFVIHDHGRVSHESTGE